MSDKSVKEILEEARRATGAARGEEKPAKTGTGFFTRLVKDNIYNWEDENEAQTAQNLPLAQEAFEADTPDFSTEEYLSSPLDLGAKPFADIYMEAAVGSEYSVDELEKMLESDKMKSQPLNMKLIAIPFALEQRNITIDVPIADAVARDAALDGYAKMLAERSLQGRRENEQKVAAIEEELQNIFAAKQAEIDALRQDSAKRENDLQVFLQRKSEEERRMADIISPFLSGKSNPVTVGNTPSDSIEADMTGKTVVKEGKRR